MRYFVILVVAGMVGLFLWKGLPMLSKGLPKEQAYGCYSHETLGTFTIRDGGIEYQGEEVFTRYGFVKGDVVGEKFLVAAPHLKFTPSGGRLMVDIIKDGQSAQQYLQWDDSVDPAVLLMPVETFDAPVRFAKGLCPAG